MRYSSALSGVVSDENGAPVREVLVVIDPDSLSLRTRTGVDGRYRITVPAGRFEVRVVRMGVPDRLITHGDAKLLLAKYGLDADGIYSRVKESIEVLDDRRAKSRHVVS